MEVFEVSNIDFDRYSNRQLAGVPLLALGIALAIILTWFVLYGTPVFLGIEFTGGTELTLRTQDSPSAIQRTFENEITSIRQIRTQENVYLVTFQSANSDVLASQARSAGYEIEAIETTSPIFGESAQQQALFGLVAAFIGMSIIVFLLFRTFVPSIAVVLSAFSDIVIPIAVMDLLGIELSIGTVAALLMLIGYSVDSDILLNNHVLRRSGSFYESVYRAMRTGVTMTVTSISAMTVMTIVSYLFGIELLTSIGFILVIGLATDLMNTYMLNLSLLRWYKFEGVKR